MKKLVLFISAALSLYSCKPSYWIGSSSVSIEPTDETVSLTLAGYAIPYEGRFTLGWEEIGLLDHLSGLTSVGDKMYGINSRGYMVKFGIENLQETFPIKTNFSVKFFAGDEDRLFGIGEEGKLYIAQTTSDIIQWEETSSIIEDVTSFTFSGKKLYAITDKGDLLEGTISDDLKISWKKLASVGICRSLTSDGKRLYALGEDNVLYQCELNNPLESWRRIGYKNGVTCLIDISQVAYLSGKLYALTYDNILYSNIHQTEGNLQSRAISFRKGNKTAVIVGVDVCGFDYSFVNDIKHEIYRKRGIPPEAIFINASHSHFTPITQKFISWEKQNQYPDSLYLYNIVRNSIIQSIEESIDNAVKSNLLFTRCTTEIGINRSLSGDDAIYDNIVDIVKSVSQNKEEGTLLFTTGCHPVFNDPDVNSFTLSANFPGYSRQVIEENIRVKNCLFLQGCAGDINPKDPFRVTGKQLANDVITALEGPMLSLSGEISYYLDTIPIPVTLWEREEVQVFLERAQQNPNDGVARRNVRWAEWILDNYEEISTPKTYMPVYVQTINIGNWKLIGLSREATSEFGLAIRNLWPNQKVSVVAFTNDVSSYLATDPHILAKDYEGYDSFFWYGQPSSFPLTTFDIVVNQIKENNR
jgi:hypothetical protein